jgi:hypothetical protein
MRSFCVEGFSFEDLMIRIVIARIVGAIDNYIDIVRFMGL